MVRLKRVFLCVVAAVVLFDALIYVSHLFWSPGALKHSPVKLVFEESSLSQTTHVDVSRDISNIQQLVTASVTIRSQHSSHEQYMYSEGTTSNSRKLLTTETPYDSKGPDSIEYDLVKCSRAMGVPSKTLQAKERTLRNIAQKADQFINAVHFLAPQKFPSKSKNFCWYLNLSTSNAFHNYALRVSAGSFGKGLSKGRAYFFAKTLFESAHSHQTLICLPSFFIAGFPKSATTSLDNVFRNHPQIIGPDGKEPHWWTRAQNLTVPSLDKDYARLSLYRYLLYFKPLAERLSSPNGEDFITYDGSQSILWDSNFFVNHQDYCAMPAVLSRVLPDAKFIVMMRNPINRLYSHYLWSFSIRFGDDIDNWPSNVRNNITEQFHFHVTEAVNHFRECLNISTLFECVSEHVTTRIKSQVVDLTHKIMIGIYHVHLLKWFQFYPRNQFLLLRMEDLKTSPAKVMSQITRFLEVDEVSDNEATQWFSKKANVNQAKGTWNEMENRTRSILEDFYRPYNKMLAELVNNDTFLWSN